MVTSPDYYEILQVSPNADAEVIEAAYRRLAKKWHPDKNPGDLLAHEQMSLFNEAFEVLYDPGKRQEYDAGRRQTATRGGVAATEAKPAHSATAPTPSATSSSGEKSDIALGLKCGLIAALTGLVFLVGGAIPQPVFESAGLLFLVIYLAGIGGIIYWVDQVFMPKWREKKATQSASSHRT
jgi:curved DNA-binding protein CbpA